jgi:hypothetical protein
MMERPVFDLIAMAGATLKPEAYVVAHRDANGDIYAFHSPLEHGPIHCEVCEVPGARIWLDVD